MRTDRYPSARGVRYRLPHHDRIARMEAARDARRCHCREQRVIVKPVASEALAHIGVQIDSQAACGDEIRRAVHDTKVAGESLAPQLLA